MNRYFGHKLDKQHILHHAIRFAGLLIELPVQSELVIQVGIFPLQDFLQAVLSPPAKADHGPQGTTQSAAAAQAPAEQPLHIDGQRFSKDTVDPVYGGLVFFQGHPPGKGRGEFGVEFVRESENCHVSCSPDYHGLGREVALLVCVVGLFWFFLVDCVEFRHVCGIQDVLGWIFITLAQCIEVKFGEMGQ